MLHLALSPAHACLLAIVGLVTGAAADAASSAPGAVPTTAAAARAVGQVRVPSATPILLELQHHIAVGYTPVDAPIWFRIAEDVRVEGAVVFAQGTVVKGRMIDSLERARAATSGRLSLGVQFVPAVDGQQLRVLANLNRSGRDRSNALVGWSIMWGLGGMMTRGANPYLLRGTQLEALVLTETAVAVAAPEAVRLRTDSPAEGPAPQSMSVIEHRFAFTRREPAVIDVERNPALKTVAFRFAPLHGPAMPAGDGLLPSLRLEQADGRDLVEPVRPQRIDRDTVTFDSWDILQHCHEGTTQLRFSARDAEGRRYEALYPLTVRFLIRS